MDLATALKTVSKAIAGALAGAFVIFLAKYNIIIADPLSDALEIIIGAVITGVIVYLAPKNTEARR
jgi:hypothetical protein